VALEDGGPPQRFALCGDVIFLGSIGRTDLPGGDHARLMRSIEHEILTLAPDTVLYSGHGPATTVGGERRTNPFVLDWLRRST
jgi:glyoxylase-like metal-dependent hydrolase (beta-lactamase superfamily II)